MKFLIGIKALLFFLLISESAYSQNVMGYPMATTVVENVSEYPTVRAIKHRGYINCGVDISSSAFIASQDSGKTWSGFDADICQALSIGFLGIANRFKVIPVTPENRFEYLRDGKIDVLLGGVQYLPSTDTLDKIIFVAPLLIHEQGFVAHFKENAKSMEDYKRSRVCVRKNTSVLDNLIFYNRLYQLGFRIFPVDSFSQAREFLFLKHCDLYADYYAVLKSKEIRTFPTTIDLVMLPETIAHESIGIAIKDNDPQWFKVVRWIVNALIFAEVKKVTKENIAIMEKSQDPQIQNLLGVNQNFGNRLGLAPKWGFNIIKEIGNYGEIFERNLGQESDFGFSRSINSPVPSGGFLWTPSFN